MTTENVQKSFNTQPPEGGWGAPMPKRSALTMFQHTAARRRLVPYAHEDDRRRFCFNTQPPEGGWVSPDNSKSQYSWFQHTAARRRLA